MKKKRLLYGFGGVALADILANSVVVLLVVIIITISITKHKSEQELEQSAEISAILARDIASSLVFNDLPSSPPAVLHNYNCQRPNGPWQSEYEMHDCRPWINPIIEFHTTYIREANSNRIFNRDLLLEENNEFDAYLRSLSPQAKQRLRADIYHLDLYYLGISIMQENGARPNHWHFVGEDFQPEDVLGYLDRRDADETDDTYNITGFNEGEGEQSGEQEGEGEQTSEQEAARQEEQLGIIPDDVSLRSADRVDDLLPETEPGLSRQGGQRQERSQQLQDIENEFGGGDGEREYSDELADALLEAIVEERSGTGDEFGRPSSVRIRFPGAGGEEPAEETSLFGAPLESILNSLSAEDGTPIDYHTFMIILIMEYLQQSDSLGFDRVTVQDIFAQITSGEIAISTHPLLPLARELREEMRVAFEDLDSPIQVKRALCSNCLSTMSLDINKPLAEIELKSANAAEIFQDPSIINTRLQFYRYPDLGDDTEILKSDSILINPDTIISGKKWYPVAILDPNISDLVVGYVYGDVSQGNFNVFSDINLVRIDQRTLWSDLAFFPLRREVIFGVLYGFLTLSILAVFLYMSVGFRRKLYA